MSRDRQPEPKTVLRFTPTAWAKLLYFRDYQRTEVGGFAVMAADDPLLVEQFLTVKQDVSAASVSFDDEAVADFFDAQVDLGRKPEQFARIWLHTHPGNSPVPSGTDEETFRRVFGNCQWAVMFILARGGKSYARLRFNVGPRGEAIVPVEVDYSRPFGPSAHDAWQAEYKTNISALAGSGFELAEDCFGYAGKGWDGLDDYDELGDLAGYACPDDWIEQLEAMEPQERQLVLAELTARPDLWGESEVDDELD